MAIHQTKEWENKRWWKKRCDTLDETNFRLLKRKYGWAGYGWYVGISDRMRALDDGVYKLRIDDEEIYGELQEFLGIEKQEVLDQFIEDCVEKYKIFGQADGYLWNIEMQFDTKRNLEVKKGHSKGAQITNQKRWGDRNSDPKSVGEFLQGVGNRNGKR